MPGRLRLHLCVTAVLVAAAGCLPPQWGANALLHPYRRPVTLLPPNAHDDLALEGEGGVVLEGWRFRAAPPRRGTIVYLHGIGDNRQSSLGLVARYAPQGWDVVAWDGRANGTSGGDCCTYGVLEKRDLGRVLDELHLDHVIVFGVSLGAAVALQAAAVDPRVAGVVSVSTFSDLRTVAHERAPWFASGANIDEAFALAERQGHFRVDDASPVAAAPRIKVPVLVIHGADDHETPPAHSQRVYEALGGPRKLVLVAGAGHNDILSHESVWTVINQWLDALVPTPELDAAGPAR